MTDQAGNSVEEGPLPRSREAVDWWLKKWGRQGVVDGKEPFSREDVWRLVEENGGTAKWLCLIGRDMRGIVLASFNLEGANLAHCDLEKARVYESNLSGAILHGANLQGADLQRTNLQDTDLRYARISSETNLDGVKWDESYINSFKREGKYTHAIAIYRRLKEWYDRAGMNNIAGQFQYREREAFRKAQWHQLEGEFKRFKRSLGNAWRRFRSKHGESQ